MSKGYVLDIESRHDIRTHVFAHQASKIVVVCWKEVGTKEMLVASTDKEINDMLDVILSDKDNYFICHNAAYDATVLNQLFNRAIDCNVICTLRLSRQIYSFHELGELDMRESSLEKVSNHNVGKHSLEAWGERLGLLKDNSNKDTDWSKLQLSDELIEYCKRDVEVLERLYLMLLKEVTRVKTMIPPTGYETTIAESMKYWLGKEHLRNMYQLTYEGKINYLKELEDKLQANKDNWPENKRDTNLLEMSIKDTKVNIDGQTKHMEKVDV